MTENSLVSVDLLAPVVFLAVLVVWPWLPAKFRGFFGRSVDVIADRRRLAVVFVAAASLLVNGLYAWRHGNPLPIVTDEFSYLLGADTFVHGRLTNPTHPMWRHFETPHVIHKPTYQSKYPPGQAMVLAAGRFLAGKAIVGVWLSLALACGAVCWMLQAWVGPRWALLGSLPVTVGPGVVDGWGQSYWGGAVAMLGGALLFGSVRRMAKRPLPRHGWLVGISLAILANSRPLEGLVAAAFAGLALLAPKLREVSLKSILASTAVPALLVLIPTGAWMGYYNHRVTGSALELPYQTWYRTYVGGKGSLSDVATQTDPDEPPRRTVRGMSPPRESEESEAREMAKLLKARKKSLIVFNAAFFFPAVLVLALAGLPAILRDRWNQLALAAIAVVITTVFWGFSGWAPHYSAPVTPLVYALVAAGLAAIGRWVWKGRQAGSWIQAAVILSLLAHSAEEFLNPTSSRAAFARALNRQEIVRVLEETPGKHLVLVRYEKNRRASWEWVFNEADIDAAKVVWARELNPSRNQQLLQYYSDRKAWLVIAEEPNTNGLREYDRQAPSETDRLEPSGAGAGDEGAGSRFPPGGRRASGP